MKRGNIIVIMAFAISALLAIAGLGIDTSLFLLKRRQLQLQADSIAKAAVHALPDTKAAKKIAHAWFSSILIQYPKAERPELDFDLEFIRDTDMHRIHKLRVKLRGTAKPKVFPLLKKKVEIKVSAKAALKLQDLSLIVDNSSELLDQNELTPIIDVHRHSSPLYYHCYGQKWLSYKLGLYRFASLIENLSNFKTQIYLTNSRNGQPRLLMSKLYSDIPLESFMRSGDSPTNQSVYCSLIEPPDIAQLPPSFSQASLTLSPSEALYFLPSGFATGSGFIPPRYDNMNLNTTLEMALKTFEPKLSSATPPIALFFLGVNRDQNRITEISETCKTIGEGNPSGFFGFIGLLGSEVEGELDQACNLVPNTFSWIRSIEDDKHSFLYHERDMYRLAQSIKTVGLTQ